MLNGIGAVVLIVALMWTFGFLHGDCGREDDILVCNVVIDIPDWIYPDWNVENEG